MNSGETLQVSPKRVSLA